MDTYILVVIMHIKEKIFVLMTVDLISIFHMIFFLGYFLSMHKIIACIDHGPPLVQSCKNKALLQ